jgi:hypothetical protein
MNAKVCKQCGELKPIEQYRKYYGGRKGTYTTCKICEKINARCKYLRSKETLSDVEQIELDKIEQLYTAQRSAGLQPPRTSAERVKPLADSLDDMIAKYKMTSVQLTTEPSDDNCVVTPVPAALQMWLKCELSEEPDYYLDKVYDELKAKYRPQLHIDTVTLQPVYDDTYKLVLEQILDRFYKYEEEYWDKE